MEAAVPSPWWTSRSTINTRSTAPRAMTRLAVMARSLKMQYPDACDLCAWWVPPAVFTAKPHASARSAVSTVPLTSDSVRSTSSSVHGRPILRCSSSVMAPIMNLLT